MKQISGVTFPEDIISVTSRVASRISEHDDGEFQALGLVYGHDPHTLGALLDNRSLIGPAALGVNLKFLDEGAEGGSAPLKMPRHLDQPLTICEPNEQSRHGGPIGCALHTANSDLGQIQDFPGRAQG
jgi:hypothetical protein